MSRPVSEIAELVARLEVNLDVIADRRKMLADRRELPSVVRFGLAADLATAECVALDAATALEEYGFDLNERAQTFLYRLRQQAANMDAERAARFGDLGLEGGVDA